MNDAEVSIGNSKGDLRKAPWTIAERVNEIMVEEKTCDNIFLREEEGFEGKNR